MVTFSVVVPTYDRGATLGRALSSVLAQDHQDWELIVVDDGSTDDTARLVQQFLEDRRVSYYPRSRAGVAATRNFGASKATGSFLAFLDSDDEVTPRWLGDFEEIIRRAGNAGYVSCGYIVDGHGHPPTTDREFSPVPYHSLAGTFALSRDVFVEIGGYDVALRQSENWDLALRAIELCRQRDRAIAQTSACNMVFHPAKTRSQLRARAYDRAHAYLRLHEKYSTGGVLYSRRERFLVGAAVNFVRSGHVEEGRHWFHQNLRTYPSFKNLLRVACFELPVVRNRLWNSRRFGIEITDD